MSRSASALPLFVFLFGHLKASVEIQGEDFFLCRIVSGALIFFAARGKTPTNRGTKGKTKMKRILMGLSLMPLMAFATTLNDGLVAWYKFDGDARDSSGKGNDGETHGVTLTTDRFDNANAAYYFDGSSHISVADSESLLSVTNIFALCAWIKPEAWYPGGGWSEDEQWLSIMCKGPNVWSHADRQFSLQIRDTEHWLTSIQNGIWNRVPVGTRPALGKWQSVVLTCDGTNYVAYLDGEQIGESEVTNVLHSIAGDLLIGMDAKPSEYFVGSIDDVRIYNRTLSGEEARALYDGYSWQYTVNGGKASVIGLAKNDPSISISGAITIPSMLGGCPVTGIEYSAFEGCTGLTSVTIPASVTTIGNSAFWGCTHLADVYFEGDTISSIGHEAFTDCYWDLIMHVPTTWQGRGRTICGYTVLKGSMFIIK